MPPHPRMRRAGDRRRHMGSRDEDARRPPPFEAFAFALTLPSARRDQALFVTFFRPCEGSYLDRRSPLRIWFARHPSRTGPQGSELRKVTEGAGFRVRSLAIWPV